MPTESVSYYGNASTWEESIRAYRAPQPAAVPERAPRTARTALQSNDLLNFDRAPAPIDAAEAYRRTIARNSRRPTPASHDILTGEPVPGVPPPGRISIALGVYSPKRIIRGALEDSCDFEGSHDRTIPGAPAPPPPRRHHRREDAPRDSGVDILVQKPLNERARAQQAAEEAALAGRRAAFASRAVPYVTSDPLFTTTTTAAREAPVEPHRQLIHSGDPSAVPAVLRGEGTAPDAADKLQRRVRNQGAGFDSMNHARQLTIAAAEAEQARLRAHPARYAEVVSRGYDVVGQKPAASGCAARVSDIPAYDALAY